MKTYSTFARLGQRLTERCRRLSLRRRGTVIIIVLALLGLLALIGFFAVTFTGSENQAATYFANSPEAKVLTTTLNADVFFNDILRQVIIGPGITEKQSAMWGGTHSLLPAMFGRDLQPFNGPGVNLIWNTTPATPFPGPAPAPAIDLNYDNIPDTVTATGGQPNLLQLNFSPAAQGGNLLNFNSFSSDVPVYPDFDANLTYPDNNNSYLAVDTLLPNGVYPGTGTANLPVRLITPSFHRPQVLRSLTQPTNWYTSATTAPYVMFPHTYHLAIDSSGNATTQYRFVTGQFPDASGIGTALVPFSIPGDPANAALTPPWLGGPAVQEGIWTTWAQQTAYVLGAQVVPIPPNGQVYSCTAAGTSGTTLPSWPITTGSTVSDGSVTWTALGPTNIGYAVDIDNDGNPDANYIDFGLPLMTDLNGNQFVALAAIKIIDADSLFNLNTHGNKAELAQMPVANNFAGGNSPNFLSQSDHGVSASEVNPQWALNARPIAGGPDFPGTAVQLSSALQPYMLFFRPAGSTTNPNNNFDSTAGALSYELANMELWYLLNGRPQLTAGTPNTVSGSSFVGRYGENTTHLDPNVTQVLAGTVLSSGVSAPSDPFPLPGTWGVDDNNNQNEGGNFNDAQGVIHPAFVQPIDFFALGTFVTGTQGKQRLIFPFTTQGTVAGNQQFPQYSDFFIAPTVQWATVLGSALVPSSGSKLLIDDWDETFTEPSVAATQTNDAIFGAAENANQLSSADFTTLGNPSRAASLAPFNFVANARAAQIRQRFTSTSWDLKSFGKEFLGPDTTAGAGPYDARRLWEFTDTSASANGAGPFRFPPNFVGTNGTLTPQLAPFSNPDDATTAASGGSGNTPVNPFTYPLRTPVATLFTVLANPNLSSNPATGPYTLPYVSGGLSPVNLVQPQRLLSVNGLTELYSTGQDANGNPLYQFRFRPLTPHPSAATTVNPVPTFASTPITPFPAAGKSITLPYVLWVTEPEQLTGGNAAAQEWLARYDRQRMARDIYTALYLMGGGADTSGVAAFNYAALPNQPNPTTGIRPVYTDDQLQEMAQFAVNLVDAMDPDSNITLFEYDKDLSDGWNLDDNAYNATADPIVTTHPADRGLVYGIERQQLCLNESMVTLYQPCINSISNLAQGHPDIQWDNNQAPNAGLSRQWQMFYTELENVGPTPVSFNNAQWQITVKQSPIMTTLSAYYGTAGVGSPGEMRLTLVGPALSGQTPLSGQPASPTVNTLPTLAAGANTGGTSPRLTIGSLIGSSGTAQTNHAIAGPPFYYGNQNPANPVVVAPSYMLIDPNDAIGTPTNNPTISDYQYPVVPRAAYDSAARPTTSTAYWFGNQSILTAALNGLDLVDPNQQSNYWVTQPNATAPSADQPIGTVTGSGVPIAPGSQLLQFNDATGTNLLPATAPVVLRIELRRRADLNRLPFLPSTDTTGAISADNPWVTVDYMDVPASVMALKLTGNPTDFSVQIQGQLGGFYNATARAVYQAAPGALYPFGYAGAPGASPNVSTERSQPLYHDFQLNPYKPTTNVFTNGPYVAASALPYNRNGGTTTLGAPLWQGNSFGEDNDAAGFNPGTITAAAQIPPHPLWQPHYDRDFSSIGELFNIPLYGPSAPAQWTPSATYTVGTTILPCSGTTAGSGGMVWVCTTAGTSGATPPSWTLAAPFTTSDGTVTWTGIVSSPSNPGNQTQMFTGLTHQMGSRVVENDATVLAPTPTGAPPIYAPERLVGADYIPTDPTFLPFSHYVGYGTAGFRFQHPEGGDQTNPNPNNTTGTSDFTENRWFRLLGLLEVPTRQHRGINEPANVAWDDVAAGSINGSLGFYRTAGKINLNTLRYPDIVAGLVGEPDIFNMNFTPASGLPTGVNLPAGLSIPYLLQDITGDIISVPPPQNPASGSTVRDWWQQFIATRDGVDPLPIANGGTGLSIPGLPRAPAGIVPTTGGTPPGSHPFRGMGFSAFGGVDLNGYNGPLESNALRSLSGDAVATGAGTFDLRRRLFELGSTGEHTGSNWDYATKQRLLSRLVGNTTTRSNVFFVWIQVDFFQAKDVGPSLTPADTGVVRIGSKLGTSPAYRGFFVIDRSQALPLMTPQYLPAAVSGQPFVFSFNQSFNWQSLVLYRQRIQ
jgi:hypothetical protein